MRRGATAPREGIKALKLASSTLDSDIPLLDEGMSLLRRKIIEIAS
ncbi:hypothetical protein SGO26_18035 [Cupriavidus metallidurans]|nr:MULTISPECIES: hypothetical protein [Cupriavidus]